MPPWDREPKSTRREFGHAMRSDDFRNFKSDKQWNDFNEIGRREEKVRRKWMKQYEASYTQRVNRWIKKLIDDEASKKQEFKPPWSNDGFSVRERAEKLVRLHHEQRLNRIEFAAANMQNSVIEQSKQDSEREASKRLRKDWKSATRDRSR